MNLPFNQIKHERNCVHIACLAGIALIIVIPVMLIRIVWSFLPVPFILLHQRYLASVRTYQNLLGERRLSRHLGE